MKKLVVKRSPKALKVFWHVAIVEDRNNEIQLASETYYSKANALRAARRLSRAFGLPLEVR